MAETRVIRRGWCAAATAAVIAAMLPAGAAQPAPADAAQLAGAWELALAGSYRKCRIVLREEAAGTRRIVRFPAGCRRALPILVEIEGWLVPAKGALRFNGREGRPALDFTVAAGNGTFEARAASGELYRLERSEGAPRDARRPTTPAIDAPQPPVELARAPPRAALPGLYAVDRSTERDVCRIALGAAMLTAAGRFEARVLDGCRDSGLAAFDPVAWHYEGGRLTLVARHGHEVMLVSERDGLWRRDPEIGSALVLRKAE